MQLKTMILAATGLLGIGCSGADELDSTPLRTTFPISDLMHRAYVELDLSEGEGCRERITLMSPSTNKTKIHAKFGGKSPADTFLSGYETVTVSGLETDYLKLSMSDQTVISADPDPSTTLLEILRSVEITCGTDWELTYAIAELVVDVDAEYHLRHACPASDEGRYAFKAIFRHGQRGLPGMILHPDHEGGGQLFDENGEPTTLVRSLDGIASASWTNVNPDHASIWIMTDDESRMNDRVFADFLATEFECWNPDTNP